MLLEMKTNSIKNLGNKSLSSNNMESSLPDVGKKCSACSRTFLVAEHFAKHRRGALCRRITQRHARQHRKLCHVRSQDNKYLVSNTESSGVPGSSLPACGTPKRKLRPAVTSVPATVLKPYQCTVCGARFCDKGNIELHLQRQHQTTHEMWIDVSKVSTVDTATASNASVSVSLPMSNMSTDTQTVSNDNMYSLSCQEPVNNAQMLPIKCSDTNVVQQEPHRRPMHNSPRHIEAAGQDLVSPLSSAVNRTQSNAYMVNSTPVFAVPNNNEIIQTSDKSPLANRGDVHNTANVIASNTIISGVSSANLNAMQQQQIFTPSSYVFPPSYYSSEVSIHPNGQTVPYMQQSQHAAQQQLILPPVHHPQLHNQAMAGMNSHTNLHHNVPMQQSFLQLQHVAPQLNIQQTNSLPPPVLSEHFPPPVLNASEQVVTTSLQSPVGSTPCLVSCVAQNAKQPLLPVSNTNVFAPNHQVPESIPLNSNCTAVVDVSNSQTEVVSGVSHDHSLIFLDTNAMHNSCEVSESVAPPASRSNFIPSSTKPSLQNNCSTAKDALVISSNTYSNRAPLTKWNMCGDCGIKFLDLMNLELHVERKHPNKSIFGFVDLGEGTLCYNVSEVDDNRNKSSAFYMDKSLKKENKLRQRHVCTLCHHRTDSMVPMVDHMLNVHFLTCKNMMDNIITEKEPEQNSFTSSNITNKNANVCGTLKQSEKATGMDSSEVNCSNSNATESGKQSQCAPENLQANQCHSCLANFQTSAELIRHRIKDKTHACVVCCYVTCSQRVVLEHVTNEHDFVQPAMSLVTSSFVMRKLTCWKCSEEFKNTGEFIDHLSSHGAVMGECEKCGKQDSSVASVLIHMTSIHSDYMNILRITITSKGKSSQCTYLQTPSGDLVNTGVQNNEKKSQQKTNISSLSSNKTAEKGISSGDTNIKKKRVSLRKACKCFLKTKEDATSKPQNNVLKPTKSSEATTDQSPVYVCSVCKVCLYGSDSMDCHLKQHYERLMSEKCLPDTVQCSSGENFNSTRSVVPLTISRVDIKRSPSEERSIPKEISHNKNTASPIITTQNRSNQLSQQKIGLERNEHTREFQCQECGLTGSEGLILIDHVVKRHISGRILHIMASSTHSISVITPVSQL